MRYYRDDSHIKIFNFNFSKSKDLFIKSFKIVEIDPSLKIHVEKGVYEPAEDSYLLIKALEIKGNENVLDMGTGCGIIALHLAKKGCRVVAVDINEKAIENAKKNAKANGLKIDFRKSNLFEAINEKFDIIVFNPPYLPTKGEDLAWDGGKDGIEVVRKFLKKAKKYLEKNGSIYIILSSLSNIKALKEEFKEYEFEEIAKESFFFERLYAYKITLK